jgi:hypothetical protein
MNNKYKTLYVGAENKRITGSIHGIIKAHRMLNGYLFTFGTKEQAVRSAQVLIESGYENVRVI